MQTVSCPGCGAPIQFLSTASVLAVCGYCKSTVIKDVASVKDLGKMAEVLEDYSPIQIGTSGVFAATAFTVIGRIQLRYPEGMWNEWYALFADGKTAWLSDASGQYTFTTEVVSTTALPAFNTMVPARSYLINGQRYMAADVRTANCIAGQGELPFQVGQGWQTHTADLRAGGNFITLDYSEPEHTRLYAGQAVTLEGLQCQLLRDEEQIQTSAGKFKGKVSALSCPACGSSTPVLPGVTNTLICPACHAQVDISGPTAQVLAVGSSVAQVYTTLTLGAAATISGRAYQIIGLMRLCDNQNTVWTEYLLHSPRAGFLWLVETDQEWYRASVMDEWPTLTQGDTAMLGSTAFQKHVHYPAKVIYAIGAFNWRVGVGYQTDNIEFQNGSTILAAEMTGTELTWSQSTPVSADQISAWFGNGVQGGKQGQDQIGPLKNVAYKWMAIIALLNFIPFLATDDSWIIIAIGCAALYYPAKYLDDLQGGDS